tara:strand:- start:143 stop:373 length:231 start_codon:yes stop_codon:yes gene_type:complete
MRLARPFFAILLDIAIESAIRPLAVVTIDQSSPAISHARSPALKLKRMIAASRSANLRVATKDSKRCRSSASTILA